YLDNMAYVFEKSSTVIEKDSITTIDTMFQAYAYSPDYGVEFWRNQFSEDFLFRIYPSKTFSHTLNGQVLSSKQLMPLVIKNHLEPNMYVVGFLDAGKLYQDFHNSVSHQFMI